MYLTATCENVTAKMCYEAIDLSYFFICRKQSKTAILSKEY